MKTKNSKIVSTKQVIVVRKDLKMNRGKEGAQIGHAACAFMTDIIKNNIPLDSLPPAVQHWIKVSFPKIVVQVNSHEELMRIYEKSLEKGVLVRLITDAGKTYFDGKPTDTVLAVGPDYSEIIDEITGHLKLY